MDRKPADVFEACILFLCRSLIDRHWCVAQVASYGIPSFNWVLARRPSAQPWYVGACHGSEQAFVFGNPRWMWYKDQAFEPSEAELSTVMQSAWVKFAATGEPGWARFSPTNSTMVFDLSSKVETDYNKERCDFWARGTCKLPSWSAIETRVRAAMGGGPAPAPAPTPAPKPHPGAAVKENWIQGWNSWDSLGTAINETNFLAHCQFMADHLLEFGYDHCMIDAGWSAQGHAPENFLVDGYGRPLPNPRLFPSAGPNGTLGFAPLAKKVHALGLKFGFHDWRGVLPTAVAERTPVLGAPGYTAADIVMAEEEPAVPGYHSDPCRNNAFSRGVNMSHPAGQAFYDSLVELWTSWGTDIVKVDCNRLKWEGARQEVFGLASAFEKSAAATNHEITYIMSPGGDAVCGSGCGTCSGKHNGVRSIPCNPALKCNASTLWRTSLFRMDHGIDGNWVNGTWIIPVEDTRSNDYPAAIPVEPASPTLGDVHDRWSRDIINMFPVCASWASKYGPGARISLPHGLYDTRARPYIDMLPVGEMSSNVPRGNKMTPSQQQVAFTLWSVFGSPLVLGTALVRMSAQTLAMVTNKEVIAMARDQVSAKQLWWDGVPCAGATGKHSGVPCAATTAWAVDMPSAAAVKYYALFNLGPEETQTLHVTGVRSSGKGLFDVWRQAPANGTLQGGVISVAVPANSTVLLRVKL